MSSPNEVQKVTESTLISIKRRRLSSSPPVDAHKRSTLPHPGNHSDHKQDVRGRVLGPAVTETSTAVEAPKRAISTFYNDPTSDFELLSAEGIRIKIQSYHLLAAR